MKNKKVSRIKRKSKRYQYQTKPEDFFQMQPIDLSLLVTTNSIPNTNDYNKITNSPPQNTYVNMKAITVYTEETEPGEEEYNYENFKKEYEEQLGKDLTDNKLLNYTYKEQSEEYPKDMLQKLLDFKNCTETSKQLGIKAIDCLIYNYEHKTPALKKPVQKMWLVIRVWFFIYVCLAIPCWCQKGWCCCCFRCKFCFPNKRILFSKQYYAINPPGTLVTEVKKKGETQQLITYEPTEFEEDTFEQFETVIRNI
ncbi:uncharacterized protein LOC116427437 [Nomia melanderi]|uniref:uncharacterized protein LOC116427437 n=1 Tax=Nomia melanderi TaxID=2448451 RepID=UPI003FCEC3E8